MRFLILISLVLFSAPGFAETYRITFDATWSFETHPRAYPGPAAHFSAPIGTTHAANESFFRIGEMASSALESLAEDGNASAMRELMSGSGNLISGTVFNSPGEQSWVVDVTEQASFVSMASMIAPSPDWFVGVSGFNMLRNGVWIEEASLDLFPLDAGTEEGRVFNTTNRPSMPPQRISRLDRDRTSGFFGLPPVATLTFDRLFCDFDGNGRCDVNDLNSEDGLYSVGDLVAGVPVTNGEIAQFDLTLDDIVNSDDLDRWLADAATINGFAQPYLKGDVNLNDHVGTGDFVRLSRTFGQGTEWSEGNFRGSGTSSVRDFIQLSRNFGRVIPRLPRTATVPEPQTGMLALMFLVLPMFLSRRR